MQFNALQKKRFARESFHRLGATKSRILDHVIRSWRQTASNMVTIPQTTQ